MKERQALRLSFLYKKIKKQVKKTFFFHLLDNIYIIIIIILYILNYIFIYNLY